MNLNQFTDLQKELVKHRYAYYILDNPIISDYAYDMLEAKSLHMAKTLGFRADIWEGPAEAEKDHVHWMVDFNFNNPYVDNTLYKPKD